MGETLPTVHRFAMISIDEIRRWTFEAARFGDLKTYVSWHADSPSRPKGRG